MISLFFFHSGLFFIILYVSALRLHYEARVEVMVVSRSTPWLHHGGDSQLDPSQPVNKKSDLSPQRQFHPSPCCWISQNSGLCSSMQKWMQAVNVNFMLTRSGKSYQSWTYLQCWVFFYNSLHRSWAGGQKRAGCSIRNGEASGEHLVITGVPLISGA